MRSLEPGQPGVVRGYTIITGSGRNDERRRLQPALADPWRTNSDSFSRRFAEELSPFGHRAGEFEKLKELSSDSVTHNSHRDIGGSLWGLRSKFVHFWSAIARLKAAVNGTVEKTGSRSHPTALLTVIS
jgi:hypothetical protein